MGPNQTKTKPIPIKERRGLINPTRNKHPTPAELLYIAHFGKCITVLPFFEVEDYIDTWSITIINLELYLSTYIKFISDESTHNLDTEIIKFFIGQIVY